MARDSKTRIEAAASDLMARDGYTGTGLKAISDAVQLPYGSIYHHFPGGKEEIAAAAISSTGRLLGGLLEGLVAEGLTDDAVRSMFGFMADRLEGSGWVEGCSIGTPSLDGSSGSAVVREACAAAFQEMARPLAAALVHQGADAADARALATTLIATYEGATMLARAQQSTAPLDAACEAMIRLVGAAGAAGDRTGLAPGT